MKWRRFAGLTMSIIGTLRVAAVASTGSLGDTFSLLRAGPRWRMRRSLPPQTTFAGTDAMHTLLLLATDRLAGWC